MNRKWFAIYDPDPSYSGCIEITPESAPAWNERGYGIFWSVQDFHGPRRLENLAQINSWYFEIDQGEKTTQWAKIKRGLIPSLIVESKRGFHVYFNAKNASRENWEEIVSRRLIPFYQADPNVHDLARILRVPGFYHYKDLLDPFLVSKVWESSITYSEEDLLLYYPIPASPKHERGSLSKTREELRRSIQMERFSGRLDLWDRIWEMDCELALGRLSGSPYVRGELYSFKHIAGGKLNILVNGEMTGCWIDAEKRIGSRSGGGPVIWQWLKWYGHSDSEVYRIMCEVFPEVMEEAAS